MWFWNIISLSPFVSVPLLGLFGHLDIAIGAIGVIVAHKLIKYASIPYLDTYKWLQRPSGARNCSCFNTGGSVAGRPGFPSGHAAITSFIVVAVLLSYPSLKRDTTAWVVGVIIIMLVNISRIKKKCHTSLQVVAGTLFGITFAVALQALKAMQWMKARKSETS
jgi:membrane-associated phospholipid phosphatase